MCRYVATVVYFTYYVCGFVDTEITKGLHFCDDPIWPWCFVTVHHIQGWFFFQLLIFLLKCPSPPQWSSFNQRKYCGLMFNWRFTKKTRSTKNIVGVIKNDISSVLSYLLILTKYVQAKRVSTFPLVSRTTQYK